MARALYIFLTLLVFSLLMPVVLLCIDLNEKYLRNDPGNDTIILPPPDNSSIIDNSTDLSPASGTGEPAPSSKYALYDNFSTDTGLWQKNSRTWSSSSVHTVFQTANVYLSDGKLVLYADSDKHIGGEIQTKQKYGYGKYRASIKTVLNAGCYECFFSYIWSPHNEIDGPELWKRSGQSGPVMANFNNALGDGKANSNSIHYTLSFDPGAAYHVYGYNWYPDRIEYVIDDEVVATSTEHLPNQDMNVYFENWIVKSVPEDHGTGQNYEYVDWVTYEPL